MNVRREHKRQRDETPAHHDPRNPNPGAHSFKYEVARHFENEVGDEKDAGAKAVDRVAELQVGAHLQLGESDVHSIEEVEDIAEEQERNDPLRNFCISRRFKLCGKVVGQLSFFLNVISSSLRSVAAYYDKQITR
jgi:hypothetical protein